jgi:hypothetical protein
MLPQRAIRLIREFSKPRTSPYWRGGTSHAILFRQSEMMQVVIQQIIDELNRKSCDYTKWGQETFDMIEREFPNVFEYTGCDYIQIYGEELLDTLSYKPIKGKHMNFYYCARHFLKDTRKFKLIMYEVNGNHCEEWIKY